MLAANAGTYLGMFDLDRRHWPAEVSFVVSVGYGGKDANGTYYFYQSEPFPHILMATVKMAARRPGDQ